MAMTATTTGARPYFVQGLRELAVVSDTVGDLARLEGVTELGATVAREDDEAPRLGPLVVRCPCDQLAQLLDELGRNSALGIDAQVRTPIAHQVDEVAQRVAHCA